MTVFVGIHTFSGGSVTLNWVYAYVTDDYLCRKELLE